MTDDPKVAEANKWLPYSMWALVRPDHDLRVGSIKLLCVDFDGITSPTARFILLEGAVRASIRNGVYDPNATVLVHRIRNYGMVNEAEISDRPTFKMENDVWFRLNSDGQFKPVKELGAKPPLDWTSAQALFRELRAEKLTVSFGGHTYTIEDLNDKFNKMMRE